MPEKPPANPGRRAPCRDLPLRADGGNLNAPSGSLPLIAKIVGAAFGTIIAPILVGLFLKYLDSRDPKVADGQAEPKSEAVADLGSSAGIVTPVKAAPAKAGSAVPTGGSAAGEPKGEVASTSASESEKAPARAALPAPRIASVNGPESKKSPASAVSPAAPNTEPASRNAPEHAKVKKKKAAAAAVATADPWQPSPGFTALLNGRDLTGWTGGDNRWSIDAAAHSLVGNDLTATKAYLASWIYTQKQFSDFRLRFEYRAQPQSDGGLAVRTAEGARLDDRYEIQLLGDQDHPISTGTIMSLRVDRNHPHTRPRVPVPLRPQRAWNVVEVEFRGPRLRLWINGDPVQDVRFDQHAEAKKIMGDSGRIAFQSRSGRVEFRRIEIQELKGAARHSSK